MKNGFTEAVVRRCSIKKVFLKLSQNSQENACARVSFSIKLHAEAQVLSYEFCEIFKNICFIEHLQTTASEFTFQNNYTEVETYI